MILQIAHAIYRIVLETSGASNFRIVESHWRDFAVFVSLSSRTNTRQGLRLCDYFRLMLDARTFGRLPRVRGL
jgi:hypothetical protein